MSELSNIKSTLLAEQVQEQLYQYILDNHYEIGTKIPNEFELARYFGVGRSTIREAVKLLISKGVLEEPTSSAQPLLTWILWVFRKSKTKWLWPWIWSMCA